MKPAPAKGVTVAPDMIDVQNGVLDVSSPVLGVLSTDQLNEAFKMIERFNQRVEKVLINADTFDSLGTDVMDVATKEEMLKTGCMGHMWAAQLYVTGTTDIWIIDEEPDDGG
jgi:uncharacterized protein YegJ (DUF2314 family)